MISLYSYSSNVNHVALMCDRQCLELLYESFAQFTSSRTEAAGIRAGNGSGKGEVGPAHRIRERTKLVRLWRFVTVEILTAIVRALLLFQGPLHLNGLSGRHCHVIFYCQRCRHPFLFGRMHHFGARQQIEIYSRRFDAPTNWI